MKKIGFVGLGNMGMNMANNLLSKGFEIKVFDIRRQAIDAMVAKGAVGAASLRDAGADCDIVFVMVLNFPQIQSVVFGNDGVVSGMKPGSTLIVTSTIAPSETRQVAEYAAKRGVRMLDAPVSGGVNGAAGGTLVLMVAGEDGVFEECRDALFAVGSNTVKVGREIGMGQTVKAVNQLLVSVNMAAVGEALVLAQKSGIDPELLVDIISKSVGSSYVFNLKAHQILDRDFEKRGALNIHIKDLDICLKIGRELNVPLFLSGISRELFITANGMGYGNEDYCAITKVYENAAGVQVARIKK